MPTRLNTDTPRDPEAKPRKKAPPSKRDPREKPVDPKVIERMAASGMAMTDMAKAFDVDEAVIRRRFGKKVSAIRTEKGLKDPDGRKPADIDPDMVRKLANMGASAVQIGKIVGVHKSTVLRRFAPVLQKAAVTIDTRLQFTQIKLALEGDRTMLIWLGKNRLGQTDKIEETVKGGLIDPNSPLGVMLLIAGQKIPGLEPEPEDEDLFAGDGGEDLREGAIAVVPVKP